MSNNESKRFEGIPSFSIYVPGREDSGNKIPTTYFRLGEQSSYSVDGEPFDKVDQSLYGIYMYTDGFKKETIKGDVVSVKTDKNDGVVSVEYIFNPTDHTPHKVSWSRSSSTNMSTSEATNVSLGYTSTFGASVAQTVTASMPLQVSAGASVTAKLDPLAIEMSKDSLSIKTPIPGLGLSLAPSQDSRGYQSSSITASNVDTATFVPLIKTFAITYQIGIAAIALIASAMYITSSIRVPVEAKDSNEEDDKDVRSALEEFAIYGKTVQTMMSTMQALGLAMGAAALIIKKAAKIGDETVAAKVTVASVPLPTAQMRVGMTSFIEMTPGSITIASPIVSISAATFKASSPLTTFTPVVAKPPVPRPI